MYTSSSLDTDELKMALRARKLSGAFEKRAPDAGQIFVISMEFSAVNRRLPSRETPLGPGAKKDGCFRRLGQGFTKKKPCRAKTL